MPGPFPRLRPGLLAVEVDGDLVVVDPAEATAEVLRGGAVLVWAALELHGGSAIELTDAVRNVLGATPDDLERIVVDVLDGFRALGYLEVP